MLVLKVVFRSLLRGAWRARRSGLMALIGVITFIAFAVVPRSASAANSGYCFRVLSETDQAYRVITEAHSGCDIYKMIRLYPQKDGQGNVLPDQVQLRSIHAANLIDEGNGKFSDGSIKRRCTKDGRPSPDSNAEELAICKHLVFFYDLPNVSYVVPKARVYTPAENRVRQAAEEAEKAKRDAAAAKAAEEAHQESEAFKRAAKAEDELKLERKRSAGLQSELNDIADKAWRVATFPELAGAFICALAYALLASMLAAHYRFKLRPLTVDGYGYPDPLAAVQELNMKLLALRDEVARWRRADSDRRSLEAAEQKKGSQELQDLQQRAEAAEAEALALKKENEGIKSNLEALRKARASESGGTPATVKLLEERLSTATMQYNELDGLHKGLQETRRRQAVEIQRLQQENDEVRACMARVETEKQGLSDRLKAIQDERLAENSASWHLASVADPEEAVTQVRTPSRDSVTPDSVADAIGFAKQEARPQEPEELFAGLAQELTDARRERDLFRGGLLRISGLLSWVEDLEAESFDVLRTKTDKIIVAVTDACRNWASTGHPTTASEVQVESNIPTVSASEVVRIAKMSDMLQERAVDIQAFRGIMGDVSTASVGQCLKACIHEWAIRSEGEPLAFVLEEPHEAFDLNRLLLSHLGFGPRFSSTVTSRFAEAVDRVHLACAPEFSRRAVSGSVPPSAVPQAAG